MLYHAKNGSIRVDGADMDYISFGNGKENLVMLPGLGDGLSTVKGMALPFAFMYRIYAKEYKVYVFSRKNCLPEGYTTRDMARDQARAMESLGIQKASVLGISQGGMIAQYLAIDYPAMVEKLVLAVTLCRQNETMQKAVNGWIESARQGNYKELVIDTAEKSYTEDYLKKYRFLYPILGKAGKPKSFDRFLVQAVSCIGHDSCGELNKIVCPVLVIGGGRDRIAGRDAASELSGKIRNSQMFIYEELGHAAYEEGKDFNRRVIDFLKQ